MRQPDMLRTKDISLNQMSGLLAELEDLKRQQPAHYTQSIASTLFTESWRRLLSGEEVLDIALKITTKALVSILLPGCDATFFRDTQLRESDACEVYQKALYESTHGRIETSLYEQLSQCIPAIVGEYFQHTNGEAEPSAPAWFVNILCRQPRAGATKPGKPRLLLIPPEMHSDHCLTTALFAVLLSPFFEASVGQPFLTGLSHHLHNAVLPDCGFGGEVLLEPWLAQIIRTAQDKALADLNPNLAQTVRESLAVHENLAIAEGRAASAADVLDRVLDVQWRTRAAQVKNEDILSELELVHAGPIQQFQTQVLSEMGVWGDL